MNRFLLFILVLSRAASNYGQTDSLPQGDTDLQMKDGKYFGFHRMLCESGPAETKHLWKLDLANSGLLTPQVYYEQRVFPWLSAEFGLKAGIDLSGYNFDGFIDETDKIVNTDFTLKYYYNLKRREKLGKRTSGFTGNYFFLNLYSDYTYKDELFGDEFYYGIRAGYGLQRRLGSIGYFELLGGLQYRKGENSAYHPTMNPYVPEYDISLTPFMEIKIGIALDSFGDLKPVRGK